MKKVIALTEQYLAEAEAILRTTLRDYVKPTEKPHPELILKTALVLAISNLTVSVQSQTTYRGD